MDVITIFYITLVFALNMFVWIILPMILSKQIHHKKTNWYKVTIRSIQIVFSFISLVALFHFFGIDVKRIFNTKIISLGENFVISGFVLISIFVTIAILVILNRFLNKVTRQMNGYESYPKVLIVGVRRWITYVVFLGLVSAIIKFSSDDVSVFSATLFQIQQAQITIGKIIQAVFICYTIYVSLIVSEYLYSDRIKNKGIDAGKGHTVFQIVRYFIWVITIVLLLSNFGLKVDVLLASSAALFVGIGFGMQSLFNDFVSGLIILFEGTIRVNDVVETEVGIVGKVQEIGLRTSKLLTRDNIITIVPNNNFVGKNVINWSYNEHKTRFKVNVGVAYGSDVRLVEKILIECAQTHEKIHNLPEPFVYFNDFGESSLDFSLFFWIDDSFWVEKVRSDLRFLINQKFIENKVEIPFPQRDLHIRSGLNK